MTTVWIRPAHAGDISRMHRIRLAVHENRLLDPRRVQHADYLRLLTSEGRGWVAEVADGVAGFAVADLNRANIWALFVDPACEGKGVGRGLHDTMVRWLFDQGAASLWLTTEPGTRAERFYRTAGWRRVGLEGAEVRFELSPLDWAEKKESRGVDAGVATLRR